MIVLAKINSFQTTHQPVLGLLFVVNTLKKHGFDVTFFQIPYREVWSYAEKIDALSPIFDEFSVFNGEPIQSHAWLCRKLKTLTDAPIVL